MPLLGLRQCVNQEAAARSSLEQHGKFGGWVSWFAAKMMILTATRVHGKLKEKLAFQKNSATHYKARYATSPVQTRNRAGHKRKLQIKTSAAKSTVTWQISKREKCTMKRHNHTYQNDRVCSDARKKKTKFWQRDSYVNVNILVGGIVVSVSVSRMGKPVWCLLNLERKWTVITS